MREKYSVNIRVISQKGKCTRGHKVGDEWTMYSGIPGGICSEAFHAIYPNLRVLMFGGSSPYGDDPEVSTRACPDGDNPVIFELRRLRK
jgi:uncharacterized repeat protein (TIGR04076 family)